MPTTVEIRDFIFRNFGRDDLDSFCLQYFRDVYEDYEGAGLAKRVYVRRLVEHCERRDLIKNLLAALQRERPVPFVQHFSAVQVETVLTRARNPKQVFISHAHQDAEFAHQLAVDLQRIGLLVWLAPDSIEPGEMWMAAIDRGLKESGVFVVVLTPHAVTSEWMRGEANAALSFEQERQMRVLPLMIEQCKVSDLSVWLSNKQHIPFTDSYDRGLTQLLIALDGPSPSQLGQEVEKASSDQSSQILDPRADLLWQNVQTTHLTEAESTEVLIPPISLLVITHPFHLELVRVPAGEFLMGSDPAKDKDAQASEQPQHRVYLDEYFIGKYPVTNEQFAAFAMVSNRGFKLAETKERHPVVNVSWNDAIEFCQWLSKTTRRMFELPTEAQREKAARGTDGRIYSWGDDPPNAKRCNFAQHVGDTTSVGRYSPEGDSPYGVADMAGNVWEWCADWFDEKAYQGREKGMTRNPRGPSVGDRCVVRGGSWHDQQDFMRCASRGWIQPANDDKSNHIGFRVVVRFASSDL